MSRIAAFTIAKNETVFLPAWVAHYERMGIERKYQYILDHGGNTSIPGVNFVPVHNVEAFSHIWLRDVVRNFQQFSLQSYKHVLFAEADEFVALDVSKYPGGFPEYFSTPRKDERCMGFELLQIVGEQSMDFMRPVLPQRKMWAPSELYSKQAIASKPYQYSVGFHKATPFNNLSQDLILIHCHRADYEVAKKRHEVSAAQNWAKSEIASDRGSHNRLVGEAFDKWFYSPETISQNYERLVPSPVYQWEV